MEAVAKSVAARSRSRIEDGPAEKKSIAKIKRKKKKLSKVVFDAISDEGTFFLFMSCHYLI